MVGADEIDDQLEPEVKDEMKKYGQVNKVIIFRVSLAHLEARNFSIASVSGPLLQPAFLKQNICSIYRFCSRVCTGNE